MLDERLPPHLRRIPFHSARAGRPAYCAARPRLARRTGHSSPHECRPAHTGATVRILSLLYQRRNGGAPKSVRRAAGELRVGVAGRLRPAVVTAVTAVMTAVVTTAMMRRAGVGARAAAVRVLREDRAGAEDERQDENGRESEFLHWFSGSPLKEIGSDLKRCFSEAASQASVLVRPAFFDTRPAKAATSVPARAASRRSISASF